MNGTASPGENALAQCVLMKQQAVERFRERVSTMETLMIERLKNALVRVPRLIATWPLPVRINRAENDIFNGGDNYGEENGFRYYLLSHPHFPNWKTRVKKCPPNRARAEWERNVSDATKGR